MGIYGIYLIFYLVDRQFWFAVKSLQMKRSMNESTIEELDKIQWQISNVVGMSILAAIFVILLAFTRKRTDAAKSSK